MSDRNHRRITRKNRPPRKAAGERDERSCAYFLSLTDKSLPDFTVRVADTYIHALGGFPTVSDFPELEESLASYSDVPLERHRQHEVFLQRVFRRCEREIMNDPSVRYPDWRPQFNGKTGTMSQLLQNGFYVYYAKLLERGIETNILADALSLLTHLRYSADPSLFSEAEKSAIQTIFRRSNEAGFRLPSREWWDEEARYLAAKKAIVESKEAWANVPPERKMWRFLAWAVPAKDLPPNRLPSEGIQKPEELGLPSVIYDIYDYYPYNMIDSGVFEEDLRAHLQKLETLRDLLTPLGGGRRKRSKKSRRSMK